MGVAWHNVDLFNSGEKVIEAPTDSPIMDVAVKNTIDNASAANKIFTNESVDFDFVPPGSFDLDNTPIAVKGGSLNYELIDEDSVDQAGGLAGEIIKDGSDHWKGFTEGVANMKIVKDIERIRKAYSILKTAMNLVWG